jgi:hypothetical protein
MKGGFESLRKAFVAAEAQVDKNVVYESSGDWLLQDSPLLPDHENLMDRSFDSDFKGAYPEEYKNIKEYIESFFPGGVVGIELGGRALKLFSAFRPDFIKKSLGVVLHDNRREEKKKSDSDQYPLHEVISADLFSSKGKQLIQKWLEGEKADLVFERLDGPTGNKDGPHATPEFMAAVFERWYQLLSDRAVMFIQSPMLESCDADDLEKKLEKLERPGLHISCKRSGIGEVRLYIILEKSEGAPRNLFS